MITVSLVPDIYFTANDRLHYMEKARRTAAVRNYAYWVAKAAKIQPINGPVDAEYVIYWPRLKRNRDRLNLAPMIKACVDAFGPSRKNAPGAGILIDDNDKIIRSERLTTAEEPCLDNYAAVINFIFQPVERAA